MLASIPLVNFSRLSSPPLHKEECKKLKDACEKSGCFRLIDHPIPQTLMADMKLVSKHLHGLPKEIKMRNKSDIADSGYVSSEAISPLYEGLGIYDMHSSLHAVQDFCSQLVVSSHHRQIIEEYGKAIHDLASSVSQKMAESLDIKDTNFKDWPFIFRLIKYDFTPQVIGSVGVLLHSDTGFITLLQDDENVGGLELMDDSRSFKAIPPKPGSFLCIIGDVGHVWSNGKFRNVKHRVICKETTTRYSFGAFMLASRDGNVEAHAKLVELDQKRLYHKFKYEDMREFRITTGKRAGEYLDQFRIVN